MTRNIYDDGAGADGPGVGTLLALIAVGVGTVSAIYAMKSDKRESAAYTHKLSPEGERQMHYYLIDEFNRVGHSPAGRIARENLHGFYEMRGIDVPPLRELKDRASYIRAMNQAQIQYENRVQGIPSTIAEPHAFRSGLAAELEPHEKPRPGHERNVHLHLPAVPPKPAKTLVSASPFDNSPAALAAFFETRRKS